MFEAVGKQWSKYLILRNSYIMVMQLAIITINEKRANEYQRPDFIQQYIFLEDASKLQLEANADVGLKCIEQSFGKSCKNIKYLEFSTSKILD